jgi:hypothetical protein
MRKYRGLFLAVPSLNLLDKYSVSVESKPCLQADKSGRFAVHLGVERDVTSSSTFISSLRFSEPGGFTLTGNTDRVWRVVRKICPKTRHKKKGYGLVYTPSNDQEAEGTAALTRA